MIGKIRTAGIGLALAAALLSGGSAKAQLAVFDGANVAQTAQAVVTAGKELLQLQQQLTQTYRMFTNGTNVTGMMPQLNTGFLQNPMPQSSQMPNLIIGGTGAMSGPAQSFYNQNHVYTATGSGPFAANLNNSARSLANIQGIAATNLASIEQRLANLLQMQTQLQAATDIKQVTAINGRIAIEQHAVQAQQAQAQNLQALATAQIGTQQQQQMQLVRQGHEQAAALFTATLN
jgi:type IV secretion system protein VirB5